MMGDGSCQGFPKAAVLVYRDKDPSSLFVWIRDRQNEIYRIDIQQLQVFGVDPGDWRISSTGSPAIAENANFGTVEVGKQLHDFKLDINMDWVGEHVTFQSPYSGKVQLHGINEGGLIWDQEPPPWAHNPLDDGKVHFEPLKASYGFADKIAVKVANTSDQESLFFLYLWVKDSYGAFGEPRDSDGLSVDTVIGGFDAPAHKTTTIFWQASRPTYDDSGDAKPYVPKRNLSYQFGAGHEAGGGTIHSSSFKFK